MLRRRLLMSVRRRLSRLRHPTWYYSWPTPFVLWQDARGGATDEGRADAIYLWPHGLRWWFLGFALFFWYFASDFLGSDLSSSWYSFGILVWMVWLYPFLAFYVRRREVLADLWDTWPPQMKKLYDQAPSLVTEPGQQGRIGTLLSTLLSRALAWVTKHSRQRPVATSLSTLLSRACEGITKPGKWHLLDTVLFALLPFDTLLSTLPSRIRAWVTKPDKQHPIGTRLLYGRKYRPAASDESARAMLERAALAEHFASRSSLAGIWCDRGFLRWLTTRCGPVVAGQSVMLVLGAFALVLGNKEAILPILLWTLFATGFLWHAACTFERECRVSMSPEDLSRCLPYLGLTLVHTSLQRTRPQLTVPLVVTAVGLNLTFAISLLSSGGNN